MKRFKVIESSNDTFLGKFFNTETRIKKPVILPFTIDNYRCSMFDGLRVRLVYEEDYIIGILS